MKSAFIIILGVLVVGLGFSFYSSQKELLRARAVAALYEKKIDYLDGELMRVTRACSEKERFLNEIEQSITELENKVNLESLERYVPKKTWSEIKPIIDRLKAFQEARK